MRRGPRPPVGGPAPHEGGAVGKQCDGRVDERGRRRVQSVRCGGAREGRGDEGRGDAHEEGQVLLLGVGAIAVVAALVLVVASATAVHLDLKTLTSLADSAAAAAVDGMDEDGYFGGVEAGGAPGRLTDAGVRAAALDDLGTQPERPESLQLRQAVSPDGVTAVVTLTARSRPPFLPWGVIPARGFTITATGSARVSTAP